MRIVVAGWWSVAEEVSDEYLQRSVMIASRVMVSGQV